MISRQRRERIKSVLIRYPALFRAVRASYIAYAVAQRELYALVRFAPQLIANRFASPQERDSWRRELPVQRPLSVDAGAVTLTLNPQQIKAWCSARNLPHFEGGDAIYLPPDTWRATPLGPVLPGYPADAGLKVAQQPGDADASYVTPRVGRATIAQKLTFTHRLQTLTFNFLHLHEVAPRLYDLIEIRDGSKTAWTAYVVEHITAAPLQPGDCERMTGQLQSLERSGPLKLMSGAGWGGIDFEPPDCNGNLIRSADARLAYVDVHNFILEQYDAHLRALADSVTELSHSGGRNRLLGGKSGSLLYQEFPGLDRPAKRSTRARMQAWDTLLQRAGVSFERKIVFDVGCNLGLIGAEYLRRGAHWVHGWDQPEVVEAARKVLLSIGCTRFSLAGGALSAQTDLTATLPEHLRGVGNDGAIVSYLAARGHVGWLPGLAALPWRYMLYEGHQEDGRLDTYVAELNAQIPVRLLTTDRVSDGASGPRDIALIERLSR